MSYVLKLQASMIAQLVKNLPAMQETLVRFLGWKIPWRRDRLTTPVFSGFPCGSAGKESSCNVGDLGLIPGLGRSPGEGKGYPLQYAGLENSMVCSILRKELEHWRSWVPMWGGVLGCPGIRPPLILRDNYS